MYATTHYENFKIVSISRRDVIKTPVYLYSIVIFFITSSNFIHIEGFFIQAKVKTIMSKHTPN